jgi:formamidopyrimidine-DNA glycosylase
LWTPGRSGSFSWPHRWHRTGAPEPKPVGPDALEIDETSFRDALAGRRAPLKALIVDQRVTAGIGNIYADEICFDARLRPDRPGGSLKKGEVKRLTSSVHSVLGSAIVARGSSLADEQYRDLQGAPGLFQLEHKVYGRRGQDCTLGPRALTCALNVRSDCRGPAISPTATLALAGLFHMAQQTVQSATPKPE